MSVSNTTAAPMQLSSSFSVMSHLSTQCYVFKILVRDHSYRYAQIFCVFCLVKMGVEG
jgi:hypothetical protein